MIRTVFIFIFLFSCSSESADRFVSLHGKRQHVLELGSRGPVVVFVAGLGDDLAVYTRVQSEVADFAHTISYDRPGIGKSELTTPDRTLDQVVEELHEI